VWKPFDTRVIKDREADRRPSSADITTPIRFAPAGDSIAVKLARRECGPEKPCVGRDEEVT
jgi:hypothetical protein